MRSSDGPDSSATLQLDLRGLTCPMPLIRLQAALAKEPAGRILDVRADDPGFPDDLPDWCHHTGHRLLDLAQLQSGEWRARVQKGASSPDSEAT